jgi:GNAT superfamily N-acetyltransferase
MSPSLQANIVTWTTPEEMRQGWPLMQQMYPDQTRERYLESLHQAQRFDYRQFAYLNHEQTCLGVVGLWFFPRIWCGLQADIDNFVVDHNQRGQGIGRHLLNRCLEEAQQRGATIATLDTFVDNPASHRFYFREGFVIRGYHFVKPLHGQSIW